MSDSRSNYAILKEAILRRQQIRAVYDGLPREFCPQVLGTKDGEIHCLVYQFGGISSQGPVTPGSSHNWRCLVVDRLSDVVVQEGVWYSAPLNAAAQTCVDDVHAAVSGE